MQNTNQSLSKLKSIARFLKISGKFYFINYNLSLFYDFVSNDNEIGAIVQKLLLKYPQHEENATTVLRDANKHLSSHRSSLNIRSFEEWVAFCLFYVKAGA